MAKAKTVAQLAEKCAVDLQLLVRMKASDDQGYSKCTTCENTYHFKELQGGHFMPRGNSATKIMEENIHPQCRGCNCWGMKSGSAAQIYTLFMIETYGRDFVDELLSTKGKPFKWNRDEIKRIHDDVKDQIKYQADRLGV
jgi:hypothetical protein|tara:strand:- start:25283 stop:25702 length:420 start_codon:yes stop_codon:yes gene_type:complete